MSNISQRIETFAQLGSFLAQFGDEGKGSHFLNEDFWERMNEAILRSKAENGWFTPENVRQA
jgi:hypothetical protein